MSSVKVDPYSPTDGFSLNSVAKNEVGARSQSASSHEALQGDMKSQSSRTTGYVYSKEEKAEVLKRYRAKKARRKQREQGLLPKRPKIRYQCRSTFANSRVRISGMFIDIDISKKLKTFPRRHEERTTAYIERAFHNRVITSDEYESLKQICNRKKQSKNLSLEQQQKTKWERGHIVPVQLGGAIGAGIIDKTCLSYYSAGAFRLNAQSSNAPHNDKKDSATTSKVSKLSVKLGGMP